ncbi:hypothetical protein [Microlunatus ginsengisoli]|jgi:hypothetical protein|uniref:DUF1453 domain-containing protein n=1 Tax=Microlunatus ginsengisoli TaxID=363863 RepID=A0ABP7AAS6_9ACTN
MSTNTIETIIIALAAIAFVTYRQTRWQSVDTSRLLRMPVILAVVGLITIAGTLQHEPHGWHPGVLDIVVLGGELLVGLAAGVLMGRLTLLRTVSGKTEFRLSGPGLGVWLGFIALRIGFGVLAAVVGATFAAQPGATILVLALIKCVQAYVVRERVDRHHAEESRRTYAASGF